MNELEYLKKYIHPEDDLEEAIKRLENGEPVQYIVGDVNFYGSGKSDSLTNVTINETTGVATGKGTQIGPSKFNSITSNNMYVGYRYTKSEVHGTGTASTIQTYIDDWYKTNIVDKGYSGKIDINAGFCGDRTAYADENGTATGEGTGTTRTYYGAYIRFYKGGSTVTNPTPTLKCTNSSDLYTKIDASKGNKSLTYPVGLITADEVNAAGAIYGTTNKSYYLYTGSDYWTMSPSDYYNYNGAAYVFIVCSYGYLYNYISLVHSAFGVRPVINLRSDTTFKTGGDGTSSNPYEVA